MWTRPVSYTHLDVYKRQALEGSVWSGRMVSAHKKAVSSLNIVITGSTPGAGVTHLAFGLCTILVADNSGDRTKGMNIMHSCYALGALLCPFFIGAAMKAGNAIPMLVLAACGLLLWLTFCVTPAETKAMKKDRNIDKSFLKSRKFWIKSIQVPVTDPLSENTDSQ